MRMLCLVALIAAALLSIGWAQQDTAPAFEGQTVVTPSSSIEVPDLNEDLLPMSTCFMCSKSSTDACKGADECAGTRKACRKKGCKITGTRSCSSAANVKKC